MRENDGSPVTSGDLFDVFRMLSEKIDTKHVNLRETVEDLYHRSTVRMDAHDREDRLIAERVIRIEESRQSANAERGRNDARRIRESDLRVVVFSLLVSVVVSVSMWVMSKFWP